MRRSIRFPVLVSGLMLSVVLAAALPNAHGADESGIASGSNDESQAPVNTRSGPEGIQQSAGTPGSSRGSVTEDSEEETVSVLRVIDHGPREPVSLKNEVLESVSVTFNKEIQLEPSGQFGPSAVTIMRTFQSSVSSCAPSTSRYLMKPL